MSVEVKEQRLPEREGVYFLIYKSGKVLLEERKTPEKAYYGYTIIPGGKVEKSTNESHEEALKREVREECGVEITEFICLDRFLCTSISNHLYDISAYFVTGYDGEIKNVEGKSNHIWVDVDKASEMLPFADSKYVVLLAQQYLLGQDS